MRIGSTGSGSNGNKSGSASSRSTTTSGGGTGRSDSSGASDYEDGPRASPRTPRRKKAKGRKRSQYGSAGVNGTAVGNVIDKAREDGTEDDLAYLDTLPESVKLVQVTSNIWGTKFKIHGLAKTVPSNLGQVTYKTSLLHLQPRQMTLVITELRDDFVAGPDPNFNPNVFSEDEEEQLMQRLSSPPVNRKGHESGAAAPMIAPMSPRPTRFNNKFKSSFNPAPTSSTTPTALEANLARAESYEDDAPTEGSVNNDDGKSTGAASSPRPGPSYASLVTYSRSSSSSGQSRQAISPLCCEGSVPTLQSPKNAVAPIDIIFDRPPAGQGSSLMGYSSATADYSAHGKGLVP